jgi:hypothetical protein
MVNIEAAAEPIKNAEKRNVFPILIGEMKTGRRRRLEEEPGVTASAEEFSAGRGERGKEGRAGCQVLPGRCGSLTISVM